MSQVHDRQGLEADFVLLSYCNGYFPMADERTGAISWYSPDPRAIIPIEGFKVSRSLKQRIRKHDFIVRVNSAFETVIRRCADRATTWISDEIIRVYVELHRRGFAHSVETWRGGNLVGGLYGVAIGAAFFGESMFTRQVDASKIALVALVERLRARRFQLLDTQFINPHITQFGCIEISRNFYLKMLSKAIQIDATFY
ncbi:MAG: leucyl/phenylalanyl-tRNA--protein transferase [Ignavibacteriae bacterium]|nr:leucyl/phenylalanyl-tRNA--protein transferase [Ignavibacteriota bacterium]